MSERSPTPEERFLVYLSGINSKDLITWPIQVRAFGACIGDFIEAPEIPQDRLKKCVKEYFDEAEHQDGETVWNRFTNLAQVYEDLVEYLEGGEGFGAVHAQEDAAEWMSTRLIVYGEAAQRLAILYSYSYSDPIGILLRELIAERQGMRIKIQELEDRIWTLENPPQEAFHPWQDTVLKELEEKEEKAREEDMDV